jgi:hypothetical protein
MIGVSRSPRRQGGIGSGQRGRSEQARHQQAGQPANNIGGAMKRWDMAWHWIQHA